MSWCSTGHDVVLQRKLLAQDSKATNAIGGSHPRDSIYSRSPLKGPASSSNLTLGMMFLTGDI